MIFYTEVETVHMNYFVIQLMTGKEKQFLTLAKSSLSRIRHSAEEPGTLLWPRRKLLIRRKGKTQEDLAPIFPGYLIYEAESVSPDAYWAVKRTSGFIRFLRNNRQIEPLFGDDERVVLHFLHHGEIVEHSKVIFDENNLIRVVAGPLKRMEGNIIKVDRRKKRAKVRLFLYEESFLVDFGFEILEAVEKGHEDKT